MIIIGALFLFIAICVVGFILLQEGKGGGVAAMGAPGMENVIGAHNPLRRLTVGAAVIFLVLLVGIGRHYNRAAHEAVPAALKAPETAKPAEKPVTVLPGQATDSAEKAVVPAVTGEPAKVAPEAAK